MFLNADQTICRWFPVCRTTKNETLRPPNFSFLSVFVEKPAEVKTSSSPPPAEQNLLPSKPQKNQEAAAVEAPRDAKRESRRWDVFIGFGSTGANECFSCSIWHIKGISFIRVLYNWGVHADVIWLWTWMWIYLNIFSPSGSKTKRVESDSEEDKTEKKKRRRIKKPDPDSSDEDGEFLLLSSNVSQKNQQMGGKKTFYWCFQWFRILLRGWKRDDCHPVPRRKFRLWRVHRLAVSLVPSFAAHSVRKK